MSFKRNLAIGSILTLGAIVAAACGREATDVTQIPKEDATAPAAVEEASHDLPAEAYGLIPIPTAKPDPATTFTQEPEPTLTYTPELTPTPVQAATPTPQHTVDGASQEKSLETILYRTDNLNASGITKISYSPKDITIGDRISFTTTVKNPIESKVNAVRVEYFFRCGNNEARLESNIIFGPGETKQGGIDFSAFEGNCTLTAQLHAEGYVFPENNVVSSTFYIPKTNPTTGNQNVALLLVNFPDAPENILKEPFTKQEARELILEPLERRLRTNSYGKLSISGDVYGWHTSNLKCFSPSCHLKDDVIPTVLKEIIDEGIFDLKKYDRILIFGNGIFEGRGQATTPGIENLEIHGKGRMKLSVAAIGPGTYNNDGPLSYDKEGKPRLDLQEYAFAHESTHLLGAYHANLYVCSKGPLDGLCQSIPYEDHTSIMGKGLYTFNAVHKDLLGWLDGRKIDVQEDGLYEISPIDIENPEGPVALKILREYQNDYPVYFYIEYRSNPEREFQFEVIDPQRRVADQILEAYSNGLLVHLGPTSNWDSTGDSHLVDMHVNTELEEQAKSLKDYMLRIKPEAADAPLKPGERLTDPLSGITINYLGIRDGQALIGISGLNNGF